MPENEKPGWIVEFWVGGEWMDSGTFRGKWESAQAAHEFIKQEVEAGRVVPEVVGMRMQYRLRYVGETVIPIEFLKTTRQIDSWTVENL